MWGAGRHGEHAFLRVLPPARVEARERAHRQPHVMRRVAPIDALEAHGRRFPRPRSTLHDDAVLALAAAAAALAVAHVERLRSIEPPRLHARVVVKVRLRAKDLGELDRRQVRRRELGDKVAREARRGPFGAIVHLNREQHELAELALALSERLHDHLGHPLVRPQCPFEPESLRTPLLGEVGGAQRHGHLMLLAVERPEIGRPHVLYIGRRHALVQRLRR